MSYDSYKIEIDSEELAKIVRQEMDWHISIFDRDIELAEAGDPYMATFHMDRATDIAALKKMRKACQLVRNYYSTYSEGNDAWIEKIHAKVRHRTLKEQVE